MQKIIVTIKAHAPKSIEIEITSNSTPAAGPQQVAEEECASDITAAIKAYIAAKHSDRDLAKSNEE